MMREVKVRGRGVRGGNGEMRGGRGDEGEEGQMIGCSPDLPSLSR